MSIYEITNMFVNSKKLDVDSTEEWLNAILFLVGNLKGDVERHQLFQEGINGHSLYEAVTRMFSCAK